MWWYCIQATQISIIQKHNVFFKKVGLTLIHRAMEFNTRAHTHALRQNSLSDLGRQLLTLHCLNHLKLPGRQDWMSKVPLQKSKFRLTELFPRPLGPACSTFLQPTWTGPGTNSLREEHWAPHFSTMSAKTPLLDGEGREKWHRETERERMSDLVRIQAGVRICLALICHQYLYPHLCCVSVGDAEACLSPTLTVSFQIMLALRSQRCHPSPITQPLCLKPALFCH